MKTSVSDGVLIETAKSVFDVYPVYFFECYEDLTGGSYDKEKLFSKLYSTFFSELIYVVKGGISTQKLKLASHLLDSVFSKHIQTEKQHTKIRHRDSMYISVEEL